VRTRVISLLAAALLASHAASGQTTQASHYSIDTARSTLGWELPATLHTVRGLVPEFSGSMDLEPEEAGVGVRVAAKVTARAASMKTGNESRDKTMREKVLETDLYPEIVFELDKVDGSWEKLAAGEPFDARVSGRLTIHGKTLPQEIPVSVAPASEAVTLSGSFPILWKAYGLHDPSFGIVTVREPLKVLFRLRVTPAPPVSK
jgi:polyisoprenoid-binding protein YceI